LWGQENIPDIRELTHMHKIGFLGGGKMATALLAGILKNDLATPENIICSDLLPQRRQQLTNDYAIATTDDNAQVLADADIIILAFKPQNFPDALKGLAATLRPDHTIVSILAGITIDAIRQQLPAPIIRVMPNTACLVGQMAAAYAHSPDVPTDTLQTVANILQSVGLALPVDEAQLDAVTALSGSGPAFVAFLIDAFTQAGLDAGLDEPTARQLTLQTFYGTAQLLRDWQMPPQDLIQMVSSPGGTTVAGRDILENSDLPDIIKNTIRRAAQRSCELGQKK